MVPVTNPLLPPLAALIVALLVSVWTIPLMIRLAPRVGMVDRPDPRKVHRVPIPRVGGIGIALGAILAIALFAPRSPFMLAYGAGCLTLVAFGMWDDVHELGHYTKFLGQIIAAALIIGWGDVWIRALPFIAEPVPPWFGKPLTVIAIVGVINAINHADGLDGLAGGQSLLSLGAMVCLAYLSGSTQFLILAAAVGGGLLGFIRYNTWPARVFMGDAGSQFLGFSMGVFAIALTQSENLTCSKSLALLLVGLPVVDILAVLYQRIRAGKNWFRATRNHIHHRLLDLNFDHYQAVLMIYSVQSVLTFLALFVAYESDILVLTIYVGVCGAVLIGLLWAERRGWRMTGGKPSLPWRVLSTLAAHQKLARLPMLFVQVTVPTYLLLAGAAVTQHQALTPVGIYGPILIVLLGALVSMGTDRSPVFYRLALYGSIGILAYCWYSEPSALDRLGTFGNLAYLCILAVAVTAAVLTRRGDFSVTNLDFLIIAALSSAALFSQEIIGANIFWTVVLSTTVLLYGCELIIMRSGVIWNRILGACAASALCIVVGKILL